MMNRHLPDSRNPSSSLLRYALSMQLNDTGSASRKVVLKHCKRQVACVSQTEALPNPIHRPIVLKIGMSQSSAASEISEPWFSFPPVFFHTPRHSYRVAYSGFTCKTWLHVYFAASQLGAFITCPRPKRRPKNREPGSPDQITLPNAADMVP